MSSTEDIRPYCDDEVAGVIDRLLKDEDFLGFIGRYHSPRLYGFAPGIVRFLISRVLRSKVGKLNTVRGFQEVISTYAKQLVAESMTNFDYSGVDRLPTDRACLFVGNHRDIAGDSMLVDYALWLSDRETVRIAVGDNLVQRPFATDLMRLNKSFFIKRSEEGAKKIFAALMQSSNFIHESLAENHSIWIAQSEGRAKDGLDVTDPAIIKMFALARRKDPFADIIRDLNIVPVSISYEFDPCDYLKAKELYTIEQEGAYVKPAGEDLLSLVKGLSEFKGQVVLRFGEPLVDEFDTPEEVANAIDRQVLDHYQLFKVNYWALAKLAETDDGEYRSTWKALGEHVSLDNVGVVEQRYSDCPEPWRKKWLEMYANPVVNKHRSKSTHLTPI